MATILQSKLGGHGTATFASGGTLTTSSSNFTSNTTLGSTLILHWWIRQEAITGTVGDLIATMVSAATAGFSWVNAGNAGSGDFSDDFTTTHAGIEGFFYITNASVMSSATTTTVTLNDTTGDNSTTTVEFAIYEVSGLGAFVNGIIGNQDNTGSSSNPATGLSVGATARFVMCGLTGFPGSNLTAGAGWTLGVNAGTATIGQAVYALSLSGNNSTQFTGNLTLWGTSFVVFSLSSPPPVLQVLPASLIFATSQAQGNPASKPIVVSNTGAVVSMPFTVASDSSWLSSSPTSGDAGTSPVSLAVSVNIAGLLNGVYTGHITVTAIGATGSPKVILVTLNIVDKFLYVKSFNLTGGAQKTIALDASGTIWSEDVIAQPFVLKPLTPTVIAGSRAQSTTQADVEYICFSNLKNGTDIPRQYNPQLATGGYSLDRISQVGPGAAPSFEATVSGAGSQATITSWAGVGSVVTFQAVNGFTAGEIVKLSGFVTSTFFNGLVAQVLGTGLSGTQFEIQFAGFSGGTDTGIATPQFGYGIVSITQPPQKSEQSHPGHFRSIVWSAGVGSTSPGTNVTWFYGDQTAGEPQDTTLVNQFNAGLPVYVYIQGAQFGNGTQLVTSVGLFFYAADGRSFWYFTTNANSVAYQNLGNFPPGTYQMSIATVTTQEPIPGLSAGDQVTISGVSPSGWNSTWGIVNALNSGVYLITQTVMSGGTATYTWQWAGVGPPIVPKAGQLVTVIQTLNGNGVFNVVDAPIATVTGGPSSGTFTITGFVSADVTPAAESGQAQTAGTIFQFDPGQVVVGTTQTPIFGNAGAGGILSIIGSSTAIGAGTRQAVVFFETRNGLKTQASPFVTFTTDLAASSIVANNIPIGPPNVIRRWIGFTGAGPNGIAGPNFYTIDTPVTYTINNQTYRYTATYIDDNISTTASFVFTDAVLLAGEEIDVQGNNLFEQIELGSSAWNVAYASRMFYGLEQNKVLNFLNMSFDGGFLPNPGGNVYPLGWGVDPASNPGNAPVVATITAYLVQVPLFPGPLVTFTAVNNFVAGQVVLLASLSAPFAGLDDQIVTVYSATPTTFSFLATGFSPGSGAASGTATLISLQYGGNLLESPVFGNSYLIYNNSTVTVATVGMLTQNAYQDVYNVPIILPNVQYSVRVIARIPNGLTVGDLIVDLTQSNVGLISGTGTLTGYGITYGTYDLPLANVTGNMAIYSGTLLTTPFTTGVPKNLVLRVWGKNIGAGVNVEIDRIEIFPTANPTLSTNIRVSYVDNFEAFDSNTGNIGLASHNTQAAYGAFELHDQLYFLQSASMQVTQDIPGVEPSSPGGGWAVHEVSNRVGTCGIYAYDYGEEWVLTACRNGLYGFNGGQPIRIDFQQKELWDLINWNAGNTIVVRNDLAERRILVAVPLPTPNIWLPFAPSNPNPTTPNVILMWNYQGLDDFQEIVNGKTMHTTMFGTLVSTDMRMKMSIWQIPTAYIGLITQPDLLTQAVTICGLPPGKLYQMSDAQLSDDGVAISSLYSTFGFVSAAKAKENPLLGFHRKRFSLLQTLISGSGPCQVQVFPNYILNPKTLVTNPSVWTVPGGINLQEQPPDDIIRPLNSVGNRVYVVFSTNAVGATFNLSKLIMVGIIEQFLTVNPNSG